MMTSDSLAAGATQRESAAYRSRSLRSFYYGRNYTYKQKMVSKLLNRKASDFANYDFFNICNIET